jgi:hypothetical protein
MVDTTDHGHQPLEPRPLYPCVAAALDMTTLPFGSPELQAATRLNASFRRMSLGDRIWWLCMPSGCL